MPNNVVKKVAEVENKSVKKEEELWNKAEQIAEEAGFKRGSEDFYKYTMGVFKKMNSDWANGLDESKEEGEMQKKKNKRKGFEKWIEDHGYELNLPKQKGEASSPSPVEIAESIFDDQL